MRERRKFIRLKAPARVSYRLVKKSKRAKPHLSLIENISVGGVSLAVQEDLRQGDLLDMEIQIPHLHEALHAVGEVIWFSSTRDKESLTRKAGVRFCDVEPRDLNKILEYVHVVGIGPHE